MAKLASSTSKQPLKPSLSFHPDSPPHSTTVSTPPLYSYADCIALIEDFNLESSHRVRSLEKASQERLNAIERHWTDSISSLDHRVKELSLERFLLEFQGDVDRALGQLVRDQVGMRPMGVVEQSARKRKRFVAGSPNSKNAATDDETDLFASTTSKKQRSANTITSVPASAQRNKKAVVPGSVTRNGSVIKKAGASKGISLAGTAGSPTSIRKPARLRLRPSTSQNAPPPSASSSSNFIYRGPSSSANGNGPVPPTPKNRGAMGGNRASSISTNASSMNQMTISRKPRRGESIVVRSLNDSPLGEFVAEESDEEEEESSDTLEGGRGEDQEEDKEWDLMEKNEASKYEEDLPKKRKNNKLKGKGKPPSQQPLSPSVSQAQGTRVPSSSSFGINLPANAPSYEELKKRWKEEMLEKLKGLEQSGDLQRKGLEGVLGLLG